MPLAEICQLQGDQPMSVELLGMYGGRGREQWGEGGPESSSMTSSTLSKAGVGERGEGMVGVKLMASRDFPREGRVCKAD